MRDVVADIVAAVVDASPEIGSTVDSLAAHDRREVNHLVRRDSLTPEAALAVVRGRRQTQQIERARQVAATQVFEAARGIR